MYEGTKFLNTINNSEKGGKNIEIYYITLGRRIDYWIKETSTTTIVVDLFPQYRS